MSARQSPVERDARRLAVIHLRVDRDGRRTALEVLESSVASLADTSAAAVVAGDMPEARRAARAWQLVKDSRDRLRARQKREYDAEQDRIAAAHGIEAGDEVRVTRSGVGTQMPVGTTWTIEGVSGDILWVTVDGVRHILWAADVERVDQLERAAVPA